MVDASDMGLAPLSSSDAHFLFGVTHKEGI